jgi:predicted DCC family thiol-disulfide oxidoreductase YuxK
MNAAYPERANENLLAGRLQDRLLVVFDGECGFCNRGIRWLLRRDGHDRLRFAPSSDPTVQELLTRHGFKQPGVDGGSNSAPDTILVLRNVGTPVEELLVRSNAILACLRVLPQPWPTLAALLRLVPRPVRESAYKYMASNRYRVAGRYESCPIPTAAERRHFL